MYNCVVVNREGMLQLYLAGFLETGASIRITVLSQ